MSTKPRFLESDVVTFTFPKTGVSYRYTVVITADKKELVFFFDDLDKLGVAPKGSYVRVNVGDEYPAYAYSATSLERYRLNDEGKYVLNASWSRAVLNS